MQLQCGLIADRWDEKASILQFFNSSILQRAARRDEKAAHRDEKAARWDEKAARPDERAAQICPWAWDKPVGVGGMPAGEGGTRA